MNKIIGIDFGTTNSCVAVIEGNEVSVITNEEGKRSTPSIVAFMDNGERKIGEAAKRQAITNAHRTISSIKHFLGSRYSEIESEAHQYGFKIAKGNDNPILIDIDGRRYSPQEIAAMIIQKLKIDAENYLGQEINETVLTVPAYFNDSQRNALKEASEIAGLKVRWMISEPVATALAYGTSQITTEKTIVVYRMGGGSFDVAILNIGEGVFEVMATNGDSNLGGNDFDQLLIDKLVLSFKEKEGLDLRKDAFALQRLKEAAEKAKRELSFATETEINLPYIAAIDGVPKHFVLKIYRSEFEKMAKSLVTKTINICRNAIRDAGISNHKIDEIILGGGSSFIPLIQNEVEAFFGKKPLTSINPSEAAAIGSAIQGGVLSGDIQDVLLLDVTPLSLGIETMGGVYDVVIAANTTIPTKKSKVYSTAADNQPSVEIHVLQGERPMAKDNRTVGRFILDNIPPAPRGVPQIEVSFSLDANGILSVSAKDKGTGKEQSIRIEASTGLSKEEIERMKKEAQENLKTDQASKTRTDKLNSASTLIFQTEKQLKDYADKIIYGQKLGIEKALEDLKFAHNEGDLAEIDVAMETLNKAWQDASETIYQEKDPFKSQTDESTSSQEKEKPKEAKPRPTPKSGTSKTTGKEPSSAASKATKRNEAPHKKREQKPFQVFIAYSRADSDMLQRLRIHLKVLEKTRNLKVWHDGLIEVGENWENKIHNALENSDVIVLLISADFFDSDYAYGTEMKKALQLHEENKLRVIPIIVRECLWEISPFAQLQVLPKDGKPISSWDRFDEPFRQIVKTINSYIGT